jgi:hypothetical protein
MEVCQRLDRLRDDPSGAGLCKRVQRFIVRADEKLTAFVELEWATRHGGPLIESRAPVAPEPAVAN